MHINWNPLAFLSDLSAQRVLTRFPPDVWEVFFCKSFGPPILEMLAYAQGRMKCSCKMCLYPLGDHVLCSQQHTGFIHSHDHNGSWPEDCFYYYLERNNVVVLFGTLKVQSFILTEVSDCGLLIVVTSSTFLKRKDMLKGKSR